MDCVIDTSAVSWIERIGRLDLLGQVYKKIYAPSKVIEELYNHIPTQKFIEERIDIVDFKNEKGKRRFDKLVKRWSRKIDFKDIADIEVFIAYKFFTDADEAVYANKNAEYKLSKYGRIRDIANIYELAQDKGIFNANESINYLKSFLILYPAYRPGFIKGLIRKLGNSTD